MTAKSAKSWFFPKRYGFGAVPASWEGWMATPAFIAVFGANTVLVGGWLRWVFGAIAVAICAVIARAKTHGGCHWRWG
jgi:hypothetical protein